MKKDIILKIIISGIIFIFCSFSLGYIVGKSMVVREIERKREKLTEEISDKVKEEILPLVPSHEITTGIYGTIREIGNDYVVLHISPLFREAHNVLEEVKVVVDENTKFYKYYPKTEQEYEEEKKRIKELPPEKQILLPYRKEEGSFEDLKEGQEIYVFSGDVNIQQREEFVATQIDIWFK